METSDNPLPKPGAPAATVKKRRRPALACEQCRLRKVRCDRSQPCTNCLRSRNQVCTYASDSRPIRPSRASGLLTSTRQSPDLTEADGRRRSIQDGSHHAAISLRPLAQGFDPSVDTSQALPSPDGERRLYQNPTSSSGPRAKTSTSHGVDAILTPETLQGAAIPSTIQSLLSRVKDLERERDEAAKKLEENQQCADLCRDELQDAGQPNFGKVSKNRFFGRSHWMNFGDSLMRVSRSWTLFESISHDPNHPLQSTFKSCKDLGRKIKARRVPVFSGISIGKSKVTRGLADQLVEAYLRTFESVNRILHIPTFKIQYERYWQQDLEGANDSFVVLLQLCMAIGATFHDDNFSLRKLATQWLFESRFWLMLPCQKSKTSLVGLQILCLLHHAKHTVDVAADMTWISAGTLMRTAIYMGLHVDPKHLPPMSSYKAEMRRRLWATILEFQIQDSLEAGCPPLLSLDDYDTEPPSNLDDSQITDDSGSNQFPVPRDDNVYTQTTVTLELLRTLPARLAVLKTINELRSMPAYSEILRVNSELTSAIRLAMRRLRSFHDAGHLTSFQFRFAEIATHRFFIGLHQPVLPRALKNPVYYFSQKTCVDTSTRLANTMFMTPGADRSFDSTSASQADVDFYRLFTCGAGSYRSIILQMPIMLAIELFRDMGHEAQSLCGPVTCQSPYLRQLLEVCVKRFRERIRAGETNIKTYCAAACILYHLEAYEMQLDEAAANQKAAGEVEKLVRECHDLLEEAAQKEKASEKSGSSTTTPADIQDYFELEETDGFDVWNSMDWGYPAIDPTMPLELDMNTFPEGMAF